MANDFFTSDTHFYHANIIKFCNRPYANVEEMNEALIKNWNERVKPGDRVWHTGDFMFWKGKEVERTARLRELVDRLNGEIVLVTGNHDDWMSTFTKTDCFYAHKERVWEFNDRFGEYAPTLSHFPHLTWNKSHYGTFNLHGHCHGNLPFDPAVRRMDIGVDCNEYKPFAWEEIVAKLSAVPKPELRSRESTGGSM